MEQFETLISQYPSEVAVKDLSNIIYCVNGLLKKDLADFEKEWITQCMFASPVGVTSLVGAKHNEDAWKNVIEDSFLMITGIVESWTTHVQAYVQGIVNICMKSYVPHIRKRAIQCCCSVVRYIHTCSLPVTQYIAVLDNVNETVTCRVALAYLIGDIARHRPELLTSHAREVWVTLISGLEHSKVTESLINGLLCGINGYLEHFGLEVPILELKELYKKITGKYIRSHKCQMESLNLLSSHSSLFREDVIKDDDLRQFLWVMIKTQKYERLESIYRCIEAVYSLYVSSYTQDIEKLNTIILEVYSLTLSGENKYSYKLLSTIIRLHRPLVSKETITRYNKEVLEMSSKILFEVEQKILAPKPEGFVIDHTLTQCIEKACWLAVDGHTLSDALFRLMILSYHRVKKTKPIIHALLNSNENRASAITFLIVESCQSQEGLSKYAPLWKALFDSENGKDNLVLEKSESIFNEFLNYVIFYLETVLSVDFNKDFEETKCKLSSLFGLSSEVIQMENVRDWLSAHEEYITGLTLDCVDLYGVTDGGIGFITQLLQGDVLFAQQNPLKQRLCNYYSKLRVDVCNNESLLCVSCLALIHTPLSFIQDISAVFEAFKLILSRKDVDSKLFITVLDSFENILQDKINEINKLKLSEILVSIDKLRTSINNNDKYDRMLQKKILLIFGKYGGYINSKSEDMKLVLRDIKEYLTLKLPNHLDSNTLKLNLQRILNLSVKEDDAASLHSILMILCVNADLIKNIENVELAIVHIVVALCRCARAGVGVKEIASVESSILLFNSGRCVKGLVQYINLETSPGVRQMLCDILCRVIADDESALLVLLAQVDLISCASSNKAELDLLSTIILALNNNNTLTQKYLLKILILIAKINEPDFVKTSALATKYFKEKLELFGEDELQNLCHELIQHNLTIDYKGNVFEIQIEKSLNLIKLTSFNDFNELISKHFDAENIKFIHFLAKISAILDLDVEVKRNVIKTDNFAIIKALNNYMDFFDNKNETDVLFIFKTVLDFLEAYCDVLLEFKYQNTLRLLSVVLSKIPVYNIKKLYKNIKNCYHKFRQIWKSNTPEIVLKGIDAWFKSIDINDICHSLKYKITDITAITVNAMKLILKITSLNKNEAIFVDDSYDTIKKWNQTCLEKHLNGLELSKFEMATLQDAITVCLFFMTESETVKLLIEGQRLTENMTLCQKYIAPLSIVLHNDKILSNDRVKAYLSMFIYDILKFNVKKGCSQIEGDDLFILVEKNWHIVKYSSTPTPIEILSLLSKCNLSKVNCDSQAVQWLLQADVIQEVLSDMSGILVLCPDLFSGSIKKFGTSLPRRISELTRRGDPRVFTIILDALATTSNLEVLDIVYWMVLAEDTTGWWTDAIDKCMTTLASRNDINLSLKLFDYIENCQVLTTRHCSSLLVPLLRYSNTKYNEDFFSKTLKRILDKLKSGVHEPTANFNYKKKLIDYTISFILLQILFEKVSSSSLESPNSGLQRDLQCQSSWYLPAHVCPTCVTLRKLPQFPEDEELTNIYRNFQCNNYICMASALCKKKPAIKFYRLLFTDDVWPLLVDCQKEYTIYIDAGGVNTKRYSLSTSMENVESHSLTTASLRTTRTLFLGTLSDNPMKYDLLEDLPVDDEVVTQEIHLRDNALNSHPCAPVLSLLIGQLSNLTDEQPYWIGMLISTLTGDTQRNVKWFLSQAIVNSAMDLAKYCEALIPALWSVISDTPITKDGKPYLNGLHFDMLKTIFNWSTLKTNIQNLVYSGTQVKCMEFIINTCYFHSTKKAILTYVMDVLTEFVNLYGICMTVDWDTFDINSEDPLIQEININILLKISKNKIHVPQLLPYVSRKMTEFDKNSTKVNKLSELFGLALSSCQNQSVKDDALKRFRDLLQRKRQKSPSDFVSLLIDNCESINEQIFSQLTDLVAKLPVKDKCYSLLSKYISRVRERDDTIVEMFDTINLPEMLVGKDASNAISLALNGFHLMDERMRRNIVFLIDDICTNKSGKIKVNGYQFMLKAFKDTLESLPEPPSKRIKPNTPTSAIIQNLMSQDLYITTVYSNIGKSMMDNDAKISTPMFDAVLDYLNKQHLGIRFCEIITLLFALPAKGETGNSDNMASTNVGKALSVANKLWLHVLRDNDVYKRKLLSDSPLRNFNSFSSTMTSKLLTMPSTYLGTFRSSTMSRPVNLKRSETTAMDVQIPIDDILTSILEFGEKNAEVSTAIFIEIFKIIIEGSPEIRHKMAVILFGLLKDLKLCQMTEVIVLMSRLIVKECSCVEGFLAAVSTLREDAIGSEAEYLVILLYEEILLQTDWRIEFSQPIVNYNDIGSEQDFSLHELSKYFNKLSNWDDMTSQDKHKLEKQMSLPKFWTNNTEFLDNIKEYKDDTWVKRMFSIYDRSNSNKWHKWMREYEAWPRRAFWISALTEALTSHEDREDFDWLNTFTDIKVNDCPAQWAVRIMIRSSTMKSGEDLLRDASEIRRFEIRYPMAMNVRRLTKPGLQCVQRNTDYLHERELIPWYLEECKSVRMNALKTNKDQHLKILLDKAEQIDTVYTMSSINANVAIKKMILQLHLDLNLLKEDKAEQIMSKIKATNVIDQAKIDSNLMTTIIDSCRLMINYYLDLLDSSEDYNNENILNHIIKYFKDIMTYGSINIDVILATILHRISQITNEELRLKCVLYVFDVLEEKSIEFNNIIREEIKRTMEKWSKSEREKYHKLNNMLSEDEISMNSVRLKLLRCPQYSLKQSCFALLHHIKNDDSENWNKEMSAIYSTLFEQPEAGNEYLLLNKYKTLLDNIKEFGPTIKKVADKTLKDILERLKFKEEASTILLEDLCPSLAEYNTRLTERDRVNMDLLLGVPRGLTILKFEKQLKVFTRSIKRPVVLQALLSNGSKPAYLIKTGEDLRTDASALGVLTLYNTLSSYSAVTYRVTPLGSDGGVIEFLKNHETLRSILQKNYDLDSIVNDRVGAENLILKPENSAIANFNIACQKIPVYALRTSISNECESVEDFMNKKKRFLDSLSAMTIWHWILGIGDRHLENTLYSLDTGCVCSIDWASIFEHAVYNCQSPELVPARLTRLLIAVVQNVKVLESRLQQILLTLRNNYKSLVSVIHLAFKWKQDYSTIGFQNTLKSVESKLKGTSLSYQITKNILLQSDVKYKEKYINIVNDLSSQFQDKEEYSIEEQVYSLLLQCHSAKILSVTRNEWEPWL